MSATGVIKLRAGQRHFLRLSRQHRRAALVARRRFGKSTLFALIALHTNMKLKQDVVFGSVKVDLAREMTMAEARIIQRAIQSVQADAGKCLQIADAASGKVPDKLTADDFAELYESQRLEFRYNHSNTSFNRTKVVALTPQSVGETGWLLADEIGRIRNWADVQEAITPIVQSDPTFRVLYCTTPPPDDTHPSFEELGPPVGMEFTPNPEGNLYRSDTGLLVLRVDAWDAALDGFPVYDLDSGEALTPEQSRARDSNKDAWDRNYGCRFIVGGSSACGLVQINSAQARGVASCLFVQVESDADFQRGLDHLATHLGKGVVGLGLDVATTTGAKSNPSALVVAEQNGQCISLPVVIIWKTKDPDVALGRIRKTLECIAARPEGGRARAFSIDASNEKYFAADVAKKLRELCPVHQIVSGETHARPGFEAMNWKTWLGDQLVGALDDNRLTIPAHRYLKEDWRMVIKDKGLYVCTPDEQGRHGDTFDGTKLALHSVLGSQSVPTMPKAFVNSRAGRILTARRDRSVLA